MELKIANYQLISLIVDIMRIINTIYLFVFIYFFFYVLLIQKLCYCIILF